METTQQSGPSDISKRTLVMLVVLSCVISIVGTVAIIYEFSTAQTADTIGAEPSPRAEAGFTISEAATPTEPGG
jgi:hypothetical protein